MFCCFEFPFCLRLLRFFIIGVCIPSLNFHNIMNQAQNHDSADVDFLVSIFLQQICHDCHMPCMFSIIFSSAMARQMGLSENILFFIDLYDKIDLFLQSVVHHSTSCANRYCSASLTAIRTHSSHSHSTFPVSSPLMSRHTSAPACCLKSWITFRSVM